MREAVGKEKTRSSRESMKIRAGLCCGPLSAAGDTPASSSTEHASFASVHDVHSTRSQRLACRILRELAREPLLIYELLQAGVAQYLSRLLPKLRETSADKFLEVKACHVKMAMSSPVRAIAS